MRKFLLSTLFLVIGLTTTVQADDFNMPMSYGSHADKMVSTVFNFYDSGGATGNAEAAEMDWDTYEVNNVYSGVNFVASTAGQQITLSFNTVKIVRGDYIKIYDRALTEEEKTMEFKAPTEEATWTITDSSTPITVTSTSGTLGVLYFEKQTSSDNNWEATVKAFTPAPMQYTSATVDQEGLTTTLLGKENQPLLRINVVTTGSLSPLNLTALAYDLTGTTSLSDLSQLKLYYTGNNDTFSSNQLVEEKTTFTTTGTFTTTQTLTGGNNYFWIAGNIKSTAEGNHTIDVSCPSLQINAENKTLSTPSPTGNITIENVAVMSTTPKTYSVGADGIQFYDDGGATGKISSDFEGSVTFKPSTAGKKVQITFTKLALFNTSSTGLNDVLKVFYGSEAEESQLAATLLKEVCTIQSIAADGALTITLKSTTGIPKDGFEASVSEFTPQAMAFVNSVVTHPTTASVSSSAIDAQMLCVNLKTTGTEPALTLNALELNVPCFANLSNVKAYYTGNSSTFSIENKLVEQTNPSSSTLNLATTTTLGAGDNYIWITYDIKAAQESGTLLDCSILSATLSEHKTTITNGDPEGARELKNIWVSQLGTNSCTVSGNWLFTHSPSTITAYVDSKYDAVSGDQIVTFKPANAGNVIELEFSDFEIQYSSSSYYGTRAKFEIHNGAADGQLLWSVDDTQKATTGPEGIIRSTATDGSLTVIFDAKTTSSYYCLAGWHADVREYQPSNMTLESYTAFQENTNIIMIGAKKQEIMGVEVTMTGTLNPVKATTLTFNTKGSTAQLQGASLYFTGNSKVFSNATTDSITHISTINDESTLTFDQKGVTLAEGKNYFWLTYDLKEGGDADQTIDAALVDMTIAGTKDTAPVVANPKGERLTKNIAQLQPGDNGVKTVTGSLKFYDQNGPDADYVRGVESSITFKPSTPGNVIQLVINRLKLGYSDILSIYDGATVKESADFQQKGSLSDEKTPMTLLSHAEDGSITVYFKSASTTSTYTYEGWDIDVIDYAPQALSLGEITTTTLSSAEIMKGMDDVQMLKMAVNVEGDLGEFTFNNFTFSTEGSTPNSIRKAHLYYTATTDAFSNVNELASSATNFQLGKEVKVTTPGVYYFWLTYDVATTAAVNNTLQAQLTAVQCNAVSVAQTAQPIATSTVKAGFSGSYTVGSSSSAQYADLTTAVAAMQGGIDGPVLFTLEAGTYPRVTIPEILGASATNTITIKGTGNPSEVKFATTADVNEEQGIIEIAGADYLTLDGISILEADYGWKAALLITNKSQHVTIQNSTFTSPRYEGYTSGDMDGIICADGADEAYQNNDYLTIDNCIITGSKYGINIDGTGYVALPKQEGVIVKNCQISGFGFGGIYISKDRNYTIENNHITNDVATATNSKCIDAVSMPGAVIRNNRLTSNVAVYTSGIYLRARDDNETLEPMRIYNNSINFIQTAGSTYAINCTDALTYTDVVYNTVLMKGEASNSACFWTDVDSALKSMTVKNNIFQNEAGGYAVRLQKEEALSSGEMSFAHNIYSSSKADGLNRAGTTEYATLTNWSSAAADTGSQQQTVHFLSANVLDLEERTDLITAIPIDYVTTDINALERGAQPTPGAYQFNTAANVAPVMMANYPMLTNISNSSVTVKIKTDNNGTAYVLVLPATEQAPSVEQIKSSGEQVTISKNVEASCVISGLTPQISYKTYIVLSSLRAVLSDVISSEAFITAIQPTAVSTFESIEIGTNTTFVDGTAQFEGCTVTAITDGMGENNHRAVQIANQGTIRLTNSATGLVLTGFYLKSDKAVSLDSYNGAVKTRSKTIAATNQWLFINLKEMGELTQLIFTTAADAVVMIDNFSGMPQPLEMLADEATAQEGETIDFNYVVTGGVQPYTYEWTNTLQEVVSTASDFAPTASTTTNYQLRITDAWLQTTEATIKVTVAGAQQVADFENLYLAPETHWAGDWSNTEKSVVYADFYSGSYSFSNYCMPRLLTWAFFGYSNETSTAYSGDFVQEQFRSSVGHGVHNSANYGVAYCETHMGHCDMSVTNSPTGEIISGMYITTNAYLKYCVLHGDDMSKEADGSTGKPFATGDSVAIAATGYLNGVITSTTTFPLADYRATNANDHYVLDSWQWMDLSSLGKVDQVRFILTSTKQNNMGATTPAYFCLDNVGDVRPETLVAEQTVTTTKQINLSTLCPMQGAGTTTYQLLEKGDTEMASSSLAGHTLTVQAATTGNSSIVVLAMNQGKRIYYRIPLQLGTGDGISSTSIHEGYLQTTDGAVTFVTDAESYTLRLFTTTGALLFESDVVSGNTILPMDALSSGIYLVQIRKDGYQKTLKLNY